MNKKKIIIFIIAILIRKNIFSIFDIDYQAYECAKKIFNLTYEEEEGKLDEKKFQNALNKKEYLKDIVSTIYEDIYLGSKSIIDNYYKEIKDLPKDIKQNIIDIVFNNLELKGNKDKIVELILENNKSIVEKNQKIKKDILNAVDFFIKTNDNLLKFQKEIPKKNFLNFNNDLVIVDPNDYSIISKSNATGHTVNQIPNNFEEYKTYKQNIKFTFNKNIWEDASCKNKEIEEIKKKLDSFKESHQKALTEKKTDCQKIYYELPRDVATKLKAGKAYEVKNFSDTEINFQKYLFYNENLEPAWNNEENNDKEKKGILIFTTKENYSDLLEKFWKKNPNHIKNINKQIIFLHFDKSQNPNINTKYIIDKNSFEEIGNNLYIRSHFITSPECTSLYDAFKENKNAFEILGDNNFLNNAIKESEDYIRGESISVLSSSKSNEVGKKIIEEFINKIQCHNGLIILDKTDIQNKFQIVLSQLPNLETGDRRNILDNLTNKLFSLEYPFAKQVFFGNVSDYEEKKLLQNGYIKIPEISPYNEENIRKSNIIEIKKAPYKTLVDLQQLIPSNKKKFMEDIRNDKLNQKDMHINFEKQIEKTIISRLLNMSHQEKEEFCRKNSYIFAPPLNPKSIRRHQLSNEKLLSEGKFNKSDITILAESLKIDEEKAKKILINTLRHHVPKEAFANKQKVMLYIIINENKNIKKEFENYNTRDKQTIKILEKFKIERNSTQEIDLSPQVSILHLLSKIQ